MHPSVGIFHVCSYLFRCLPPTENRNHFVFLPLCLAHSIKHSIHMFWKALEFLSEQRSLLSGLHGGSISMFTSSWVRKQGPQELSPISWYNSVVSATLKLVFTHILKLDQRKKQLTGFGKHSDDGFRNWGKLVPMSHGSQEGFLNVPQIILRRYLHTVFNLGTWRLQYDGEVHSPITQSYLRKRFCSLEWFGALVYVSRKALLKRWRQKTAFSVTHWRIQEMRNLSYKPPSSM